MYQHYMQGDKWDGRTKETVKIPMVYILLNWALANYLVFKDFLKRNWVVYKFLNTHGLHIAKLSFGKLSCIQRLLKEKLSCLQISNYLSLKQYIALDVSKLNTFKSKSVLCHLRMKVAQLVSRRFVECGSVILLFCWYLAFR